MQILIHSLYCVLSFCLSVVFLLIYLFISGFSDRRSCLSFQVGSLTVLISVDFDDSSVELNDEISEYLQNVEDVLNFYNENGQVKHVC